MKAYQFFAFAAALTLSTSSCSKKEDVAPAAQPEAAAASTDALTGTAAEHAGGRRWIVKAYTNNVRDKVQIRFNGGGQVFNVDWDGSWGAYVLDRTFARGTYNVQARVVGGTFRSYGTTITVR